MQACTGSGNKTGEILKFLQNFSYKISKKLPSVSHRKKVFETLPGNFGETNGIPKMFLRNIIMNIKYNSDNFCNSKYVYP